MALRKAALILKADNKSWIIEKIANRLKEHLSEFGFEAVIADHPVSDAVINHHMSWAFANEVSPGPSTMFITHLDDIYKIAQVKTQLSSYVDVGICMSAQSVAQLTQSGADASALVFIPPAHDNRVKQKRTVIGITTRLYPDGRKREDFLVKLASDMKLDAFEFRIFGAGWESIVERLKASGAAVIHFSETDDFQKDYAVLLAAIPDFDYYLYMGMDEGSLGTLDALAAGVKTIVTPQGFHLDLPHGITHPFITYDELKAVFMALAVDHAGRVNGAAALTWREYAKRHALLWDALISKRELTGIQKEIFDRDSFTGQPGTAVSSVGIGGSKLQIYKRSLSPRRALAALSHLPGFRVVRRGIKNLLKG